MSSCASPFPVTTFKPGHGQVHLTLLPPATPSFSTLNYTYPLKLLPSAPHTFKPPPSSPDPANTPTTTTPNNKGPTPPSRPSTVPLLFLLTYGGGLLAGDAITLDMDLDAGTRLAVTTQGSTKLFRPPSPNNPPNPPAAFASAKNAACNTAPPPTTRQTLSVRIGTNAALWLAPDPVQPFAGSVYAQRQAFNVETGGSLGVVDWVCEGRTRRGERWRGERWRGRTEVWGVGRPDCAAAGERQSGRRRLLVRDAVVLEGDGVRGRMDGMGVFGTLLVRGPVFRALASFFVAEYAALPRIGGRDWDLPCGGGGGGDGRTEIERWRKGRVEREKVDGVLWTACYVRGVCVVKFSAGAVGGARSWLGDMLRREGTVREEFGEGGLMFVR